MPKNDRLPGILIELKAEKNCSGDELKKIAESALKQISDKQYHQDLIANGVGKIYSYGVAFSGKNVEVAVGSNDNGKIYKPIRRKNN